MTNTINSNVNIKNSENFDVNLTGNNTVVASTNNSNSSSGPQNGIEAAGESAAATLTSSTGNSAINATTTVVALINGPTVFPLTVDSPPATSMVATIKKVRPKTASPTRHGPQQCQVCNKVFGNASALAKHKLTHSDERKYVCGMCSKAFKRQDHLNGHMLTHRNKKPFECKAEGCGKSYCDARSLRRHTENHHSGLALSPTTPVNATLLANSSTGPPTGLSLSPATASGDASSPHGATFAPFNGDGTSSMSSSSFSSASSSPSAPSSPIMVASNTNNITSNANGSGNEGLTKQQLDLISQIMQQTKQASVVLTSQKQHASGSTLQRPRTWNMQTQLQQTPATTSSGGGILNQHEPTNKPSSSILVENTLTGTTTGAAAAAAASTSAALIEGASSSQQQQLATASNSSSGSGTPTHINLIKTEQKPVECNLCHRKFKNIPALNGHMRLHGGYFKKESDSKKCDKKESSGPPLQTASIGVRALIEEKIISKRSKDLKGAFLVPAPPLSTRRSPDSEAFIMTPKITAALVAGVHHSTTLPASTAAQLVKHQIATQTIQIPITTGGSGCGSGGGSTTTKSIVLSDNKDATLIELLKRGTKVAVKRSLSDPQQILLTTTNTAPMLPTPGQRTLNALLQNAKALSATETNKLLHNTLQCHLQQTGGGGSKKTFSFSSSDHTSPLTLSIGGGGNISNVILGNGGDCTLDDLSAAGFKTDSNSSAFFSDNEIYGVNDTTMLLQAVDPIHLLNDSGTDPEDTSSLNGFGDRHSAGKMSDDSIAYTPSTQLQAVLNSPLPDSLAEFSTLHSKEYVFYDSPTCATTHSTGGSPLPSPLAYPTPPASHEAVAQSSPFLDDSHHFTDTNNPFFGGDDDNGPYMESEPIHIKSEQGSFKPSGKDDEEDNEVNGETEGRLQDLSFLDEPQSFLDDDNRHVSSALSAAFFSSTMTSAEEVKEALQEVLPNESTSPGQTDTEIDLYYLPMLPIQSHMMSNSDDPLLSSSPKDFGGRPQGDRHASSPIITAATSTSPVKQHEFAPYHPPSLPKAHHHARLELGHEFRSGLGQNTSETGGSGKVSQGPSIVGSHRKRGYRREVLPKPYELFKSRLKGSCLDDSPSCYTPAPILNPMRNGTGIYFSLLRDRPSGKDEVINVPHLRMPQINVGSKYQAEIPEYSPFDVLDEDDMQGTCLWSPEVITAEEQAAQLHRFVDLAKSSAMPMGSHSEESALKALLDCHGEFQSAILNLLQAPSGQANQQWTPGEMALFISGIDKLQKDFYSIAKMIPSKTARDCVQLYYFWKKLSVHYKATHLLKDWSDMAGDLRTGKRPKYENTATRSLSYGTVGGATPGGALGSGGNFTTAASNYSVPSSASSMSFSSPSPALGAHHHPPASSSAGVGTGMSKLTTTSVPAQNPSSSAVTTAAAAALTMSSSSYTSSSPSAVAHHHDVRPYICEMPDCSASFSSKAALHGHKKLHCMGRNFSLTSANSSNHINSANNNHPQLQHHHHHPNSSGSGALQHPQQPVHHPHHLTSSSSSSAHNHHSHHHQSPNLQHSNTGAQANGTTSNTPGTVVGSASGSVSAGGTTTPVKDDFPCKVCGKVFSKVKSRSAHMKSHRPQESDLNTN